MSKSTAQVISFANNNYSKSRFNALKHGLRSKLEVLPWEDKAELKRLKDEFFNDLQPQGVVESTLVNDMATTVFQKQRGIKAENASIAKNMANENNSPRSVNGAANMISPDNDMPEDHKLPLKTFLYPYEDDPEEEKAFYEEAELIKNIIADNNISYEEALVKLPESICGLWEKSLVTQYQPMQARFKQLTGEPFRERNIASLKSVLQKHIEHFNGINSAIYSTEQIKQQAIGIAYVPTKEMERLQRYYTTLDREFERKLAMFLKLRELRQSKPSLSSS